MITTGSSGLTISTLFLLSVNVLDHYPGEHRSVAHSLCEGPRGIVRAGIIAQADGSCLTDYMTVHRSRDGVPFVRATHPPSLRTRAFRQRKDGSFDYQGIADFIRG